MAVYVCARCMEDLKSMTRYVTWSLHNKVPIEIVLIDKSIDSFDDTASS
jgi:hypothetical protein